MALWVYRVTCSTTLSGNNHAVNVFHVSMGGLPTAGDQTAALAPIKTFYDAFAADRASASQVQIGSSQLVFDATAWVPPSGTPGTPGFVPGHFTTPPIVGSGTPTASTAGTGSAAGPPQCSAVVSWRTAVAGRSYRGRTFIGNLGGNVTISALIPGASQTRFQLAATNLIANMAAVTTAASPLALAVWSPTLGHVQIITSGFVDNVWDTMRSRVR